MKVFIIAAITVDGFIARTSTHGADWTGKEDKKAFVRLTKEAGTIVMGSKTFATIGRALPERRTIVYTRDPEKITVQAVETTQEEPNKFIERLSREGMRAVAVCGGAHIYDMFMRAGVVDELYITVVPTIFGSGIPLFADTLDFSLSLISTEELGGNTVLLHYKVER